MKKKYSYIVLLFSFSLFVVLSFLFDFKAGEDIAINFTYFTGTMLGILPVAFILIGLFEVWISKETIERYMGAASGIKGYFWAIVLAGPAAGGMYVSFPIAYTLYKKGASLSVIFFYIGATAICRIPMSLIEASFLGVKFTFLRLLIAIPLVLISSIMLGNYLKKKGYKIIAR